MGGPTTTEDKYNTHARTLHADIFLNHSLSGLSPRCSRAKQQASCLRGKLSPEGFAPEPATMSVVTVFVASQLTKIASERRFDKGLTVFQVKQKLEMITGSMTANMELHLLDDKDAEVCILANDDAMLGSYPVEDYFTIKVVDIDPNQAALNLTDVSQIEKMEMSTEDYNKREGSVLAFKKANKMGRFAEGADAAQREKEEQFGDVAATITVGNRCLVRSTNKGTVAYVGKTEFEKGYWVGIRLDEPFGKNDGTVKGKRYFECENKYGVMVRPTQIVVGDYPEDEFDEEM